MRDAIRFLIEVADGQVEPLDCATCDRPETYCASCPIDDYPALLDEAAWYMQLYRRCKELGALPETGGVLDQSNVTMRVFDLIGDETRKYRNQKEAMEGGAA